jgi:hypothetical protein
LHSLSSMYILRFCWRSDIVYYVLSVCICAWWYSGCEYATRKYAQWRGLVSWDGDHFGGIESSVLLSSSFVSHFDVETLFSLSCISYLFPRYLLPLLRVLSRCDVSDSWVSLWYLSSISRIYFRWDIYSCAYVVEISVVAYHFIISHVSVVHGYWYPLF